jgi:hypothetical protein
MPKKEREGEGEGGEGGEGEGDLEREGREREGEGGYMEYHDDDIDYQDGGYVGGGGGGGVGEGGRDRGGDGMSENNSNFNNGNFDNGNYSNGNYNNDNNDTDCDVDTNSPHTQHTQRTNNSTLSGNDDLSRERDRERDRERGSERGSENGNNGEYSYDIPLNKFSPDQWEKKLKEPGNINLGKPFTETVPTLDSIPGRNDRNFEMENLMYSPSPEFSGTDRSRKSDRNRNFDPPSSGSSGPSFQYENAQKNGYDDSNGNGNKNGNKNGHVRARVREEIDELDKSDYDNNNHNNSYANYNNNDYNNNNGNNNDNFNYQNNNIYNNNKSQENDFSKTCKFDKSMNGNDKGDFEPTQKNVIFHGGEYNNTGTRSTACHTPAWNPSEID